MRQASTFVYSCHLSPNHIYSVLERSGLVRLRPARNRDQYRLY